MLFNSIDFLIFFPVVTIIYYIIPDKIKYIWLLIASYYFYMCWNVKYIVLILTSTVITYVCGAAMEYVEHTDRPVRSIGQLKKCILVCGVLSNLMILFVFKYFNMTLRIARAAAGIMGIQLRMQEFDLLLPVGISFYTFQALGYVIDVYRNNTTAEKNFLRYALFVSFFPQLVAGPIERSGKLLKQLAHPKKFDFEKARDGFMLMLWGYFMKLVLADRIAIFVDNVYSDYENHPGVYLIAATILFSVQIYCDFAGYSTIAMGSAAILGVDLMENFDAPYLSLSVSEFWRRWHISLTSWFKDYLYIPLGGNRKGQIRKYINKMLVFLLSGLWHGASFTYIVWGGLNGLYQVIEESSKPLRDKLVRFLKVDRQGFGHKLFSVLLTCVLVDTAWVFFRAESVYDAFMIIRSMLVCHNPWVLFDGALYECGLDIKNYWLMIIAVVILIFADICRKRGIIIRDVINRQNYLFRLIFISVVIAAIVTFGVWGAVYDEANFIYFQF